MSYGCNQQYDKYRVGLNQPYSIWCFNKGCKKTIRRYLDTVERVSTGNMIRHAQTCWGHEAVAIAQTHHTAADARAKVAEPLKVSGKITAAFARQGKDKITYSTRQHTKTETK